MVNEAEEVYGDNAINPTLQSTAQERFTVIMSPRDNGADSREQ